MYDKAKSRLNNLLTKYLLKPFQYGVHHVHREQERMMGVKNDLLR